MEFLPGERKLGLPFILRIFRSNLGWVQDVFLVPFHNSWIEKKNGDIKWICQLSSICKYFYKETLVKHNPRVQTFTHSEPKAESEPFVWDHLFLNKYKKIRWENTAQLALKNQNCFETSSCFPFRQKAKIYKAFAELWFKDSRILQPTLPSKA